MNLLNKLKKSILVLDGAMGTMLQSAGRSEERRVGKECRL